MPTDETQFDCVAKALFGRLRVVSADEVIESDSLADAGDATGSAEVCEAETAQLVTLRDELFKGAN